MANPSSTGPVQIYCCFQHVIDTSGYGAGLVALRTYPSPSLIFYLGTCQEFPQIRIQTHGKTLSWDLNGGELPADMAFAGESAQIAMLLTRWNEYSYAKVAAIPTFQGGTRGTYAAADVGSLMLHDNKAMSFWFHYPYSDAKYGINDQGYYMPNGYRFLACWPTNQDMTTGARAHKRLLTLNAIPVYKPSDGTWVLYDHDMTNIPAVPPATTTGGIT